MNKKVKVYMSCGNVFKDLGLPHPERLMARAQIMIEIEQIIKQRGWSQKKAASVLGIPQSKVSCLMSGKLDMFSVDRLFDLLNRLDKNIEIVITQKPKNGKATTHVTLAA